MRRLLWRGRRRKDHFDGESTTVISLSEVNSVGARKADHDARQEALQDQVRTLKQQLEAEQCKVQALTNKVARLEAATQASGQSHAKKQRLRRRSEDMADTSDVKPGSIPAALPIYTKPPEVRAFLRKACERSPLFSGLPVDSRAFDSLIDAFREQHCKAGEVMIRKGEVGDWFAVVDKGRFLAFLADADAPDVLERARSISQLRNIALFVGNPMAARVLNRNLADAPSAASSTVAAPSSESPRAEPVAIYRRGHSFGELALLFNAVRGATILSEEEGVLWVLERATLKALQQTVDAQVSSRRVPTETLMKSVPILSRLTDAQRCSLKTIAAKLGSP